MDLRDKIIIRELKEGEEFPLDLLLMADPSKQLVEEYITRGLCFIAMHEEKSIGEYVLLKTRPQTFEIINIAVSEDFQRKGIGKLLIMDAIQRVKTYGATRIEIGTGNSSLVQLGLYQKCGFRIVGIDYDFFIKNYDERIVENGIVCRDMIRMSMDI